MTPATAPLAPISGMSTVGHDPGVEQAGEDPARQIENEEPHVPHGVLDVVAEHPQEQHVADEMQNVAVEEHVGEQRQLARRSADLHRPSGLSAER